VKSRPDYSHNLGPHVRITGGVLYRHFSIEMHCLTGCCKLLVGDFTKRNILTFPVCRKSGSDQHHCQVAFLLLHNFPLVLQTLSDYYDREGTYT